MTPPDGALAPLPRHNLTVDSHGQPTRTIEATDPEQLRVALHAAYGHATQLLNMGKGVELTVRGLDPMQAWQRGKLCAICGDIAAQVNWHGHVLTGDDWRHMLIAAYRAESVQTVPGIYGGFVVLGASSKGLSRAEANDVIEMAYAFGAGRGVKFRAPKPKPGA